MSLPDPTASAALSQTVIKPLYFIFMDFLPAPVLCNTSGADITPEGTGIVELDGNTFLGVAGQFMDLSPIKTGDGGSKTVTAKLSGIPLDAVDEEILDVLDDPTKWRARDAEVWQVIRNSANIQQGGFRRWSSGSMVALKHGGDPKGLTVEVQIEGYLSVLSEASNRTYLEQELFDPGDLSARAAIGIANGSFSRALVEGGASNIPDPWAGYGGPL